MELSNYLAQLLGLTLMIFTALALIRPVIITLAMRDLRPFSFAMMLAGFIGIFGGLAIILSHNIWEPSWRVLVTIFGWAALIKGVTYVAFPEQLKLTSNKLLEGRWPRTIILVAAFLLGLYMAYSGITHTA
jgi:uncharacterized membrane protein